MGYKDSLREIYRTHRVQTEDGHSIPLHSEVSEAEPSFIIDLIESNAGIVRTLEVGCG